MGVYAKFFTDDGEIYFHISNFHRPRNALMKAAGYLQHCPCGCSPPPKPWPGERYNRNGDYTFRKTPQEPLIVYEVLEHHPAGWRIRPRHCGPIADRIEELSEAAGNIDPSCKELLALVLAGFRHHAKTGKTMFFS